MADMNKDAVSRHWRHQLTIAGKSPHFSIDQLRRLEAWPKGPEDSRAIARMCSEGGAFSITLVKLHSTDNPDVAWDLSAGMWKHVETHPTKPAPEWAPTDSWPDVGK